MIDYSFDVRVPQLLIGIYYEVYSCNIHYIAEKNSAENS